MFSKTDEIWLPKILVFGADGQDGRILIDIYNFHNQADRIITIGRHQHRRSIDQFSSIIKQMDVDAIIYLAAVNLNYYEKEVKALDDEVYWRINYQDPLVVYNTTRYSNIKFVYASTCQIFKPSTEFLKETAQKSAENIYQKTKMEAVNFFIKNKNTANVLIPHFYNHISSYSRPTILFNRLRKSVVSGDLLRDFAEDSLDIWLDIGSAREYMDVLLEAIKHELVGEINFCTSKPINVADELNTILNANVFDNTSIENCAPCYIGSNEKLEESINRKITSNGKDLFRDWIDIG